LFGTIEKASPFVFTEIAENVVRTYQRTLVPPPVFDDKPADDEKKPVADEDGGGGGGDRPDFSAWKVAIKNLNK
jgi:hypothetical protein